LLLLLVLLVARKSCASGSRLTSACTKYGASGSRFCYACAWFWHNRIIKTISTIGNTIAITINIYIYIYILYIYMSKGFLDTQSSCRVCSPHGGFWLEGGIYIHIHIIHIYEQGIPGHPVRL
jgi:hypothetical protein